MNSAIENPRPAGESRGRKVWGALIKFGVPLVVSIGLCYLLFKGQNVGDMMAVIRTQCDFRWILLCLSLAMLCGESRAAAPRRALAFGIYSPAAECGL